MGKITGFIEIERKDRVYQPVEARVKNWREFVVPLPKDELNAQASRCMDCGIPYCHNGCPVNNQIPDWNDLVYRDDWRRAAANLHSTNNFPEFTGRICPAPCEASCTLNIDDNPVTIKSIECAIIDRAFEEGWVVPEPPEKTTGKKVAVIGAGPAGLAAAQQLTRAGHQVTVFEKNLQPGGLLRYGIPDFKLEKTVVERRVKQMQAEGTVFKTGVHIGVDVEFARIERDYDAILLSGGSEKPRDLPVPGRDLDGVHFAMKFLGQQNRRNSGEDKDPAEPISAKGKHVIVIGGGDTGSDCIGTSFRQGAETVTQLEIMPAPPEKENKQLSWPHWPLKMRTSSSQGEGAVRDFAVATKQFVTGTGKSGSGKSGSGKVKSIECIRLDDKLKEIAGTEFNLPADLVLLAMGFLSPVAEGLLAETGVALDARNNVKATDRDYQTSRPKVFAAGDMRRGQSLVVWAIREGRQAAAAIDKALMGRTDLPR